MRRSDSQREVLDDRGRPIHKRIRRLRVERGLAASELARRAGISPAYVTRIEKGEKVPSEEVALRIAKILGDDPSLYLWWIHGRHMSDPESTLGGYRKARPQPPAMAGSSMPFSERERGEEEGESVDTFSVEVPAEEISAAVPHDRPFSFLKRILSASSRSKPAEAESHEPYLAEEAAPLRVRVYGAASDPRIPEWLWLDPRLIPEGEDSTRIVAHRLSEDHARWLGDLDAGDLVVVARGFDDPPRPDRIYVVMAPAAKQESGDAQSSQERAREPVASAHLSRVQVTGNNLVLIPSSKAEGGLEIIELSEKRGLKHWLVGKVVLVMKRSQDPTCP